MSDNQHHLTMICQDSTDTEIKQEPKYRKRKSDNDVWSQKKMKHMMDSDSDTENSDGYVNEEENTMNSNSSNDDIEQGSGVSQNELTSDMELSAMDTADALSVHDRISSDVDNSNDGEVDAMMRYLVILL